MVQSANSPCPHSQPAPSDLLEPVLACPPESEPTHTRMMLGALPWPVDPPPIPLSVGRWVSEALQTAAVVVREIWNVLSRAKPDGFNVAVLKLQTSWQLDRWRGQCRPEPTPLSPSRLAPHLPP